MNKCGGIKILDLPTRKTLTQNEYTVIAERGSNYKVDIKSILSLAGGVSEDVINELKAYIDSADKILQLQINNLSEKTEIIDGKVDDLIGNFFKYLKKYIDNDTIYADDEHQVIKSKGGGPSTKTFDITVTLSDAEKGSVSITGTEVLKEVATEGKYVYTVGAVSDATIKVQPITGYLIQKLIVDGEDKGVLSSYTFESINANHSVRVELAQDERYTIPPKWRRSDNQQEYLGIYNATKAVVNDYPEGLTQDVTLTCLEDVIDYQDNKSQISESMWNVDIKNWNKDTQYILTIDGDDILIRAIRYNGNPTDTYGYRRVQITLDPGTYRLRLFMSLDKAQKDGSKFLKIQTIIDDVATDFTIPEDYSFSGNLTRWLEQEIHITESGQFELRFGFENSTVGWIPCPLNILEIQEI